MQQMQEEMKRKMKEELKEEYDQKNDGIFDKVKLFLMDNKECIFVSILTFLFNINSIHEGMRFKSLPLFYDIETDQSTFVFTLFKTTIVTLLFCLIYYFTK